MIVTAQLYLRWEAAITFANLVNETDPCESKDFDSMCEAANEKFPPFPPETEERDLERGGLVVGICRVWVYHGIMWKGVEDFFFDLVSYFYV